MIEPTFAHSRCLADVINGDRVVPSGGEKLLRYFEQFRFCLFSLLRLQVFARFRSISLFNLQTDWSVYYLRIAMLSSGQKRGQATFSSPVQKTSLSPFWEFEGRAGPYQAQLIAELGLDNRIQYTLGEAAKAAGLVPQNCVCMAVPVTIQSKSVFFDRFWSVKK